MCVWMVFYKCGLCVQPFDKHRVLNHRLWVGKHEVEFCICWRFIALWVYRVRFETDRAPCTHWKLCEWKDSYVHCSIRACSTIANLIALAVPQGQSQAGWCKNTSLVKVYFVVLECAIVARPYTVVTVSK